MGLFGWAVSKIGRGIEKVGDFFGSEKISRFGRKVQDLCAEEIADEESYDVREANIYTTERLNEILVSFSEGYFQQATRIEKDCIDLVEKYFDELIGVIENAPSGFQNAANLGALKMSKKRIAKTITGGIKDPLAKRMSLDDSECLEILKMDSGEEKKKAMTDFTKKVIKEALHNLSENVHIALHDQSEDIKAYFSDIFEEQEKAMQLVKEQLDKMAKDGEVEQSDKERNCVIPLYVINASKYVSDILG